jgi:hypothetical protein
MAAFIMSNSTRINDVLTPLTTRITGVQLWTGELFYNVSVYKQSISTDLQEFNLSKMSYFSPMCLTKITVSSIRTIIFNHDIHYILTLKIFFIITTIKTQQSSFFGRKSLHQEVQYTHGILTVEIQDCDTLPGAYM